MNTHVMWCSMNNFVRILFFLGWRGFGKGDGLLLEETDRRKGEKKGPPQGGGGCEKMKEAKRV